MNCSGYSFAFVAICFFGLSSCNLPVGKSLLSSYSDSSCTSTSTTSSCSGSSAETSTTLEIHPNQTNISASVDGTDLVEISGNCVDLGRKNNRIIIEVFAGEDETREPYITNSTTDSCFASTNTIRSGLETVLISPRSLLMGLSQVYTFSASGGVPPYTYSIVSGNGVIDANSGLYTSDAATGGPVIVQATDSAGESSRSHVSVVSGVTTSVASAENKKCLFVTKGLGLVADAGLPSERIFPQCHNGQFGFSVRLGKVLLNSTPGVANHNYLVRFKLMTVLDSGASPTSVWDRVVIERGLSAPLIASATNVHDKQKCTIKTSPARFNPGILYTLTRTQTDVISTNASSTQLFANASTSLNTTQGASVFEWDDIGLVDGVTYNYTLTSLDANFAYSPTPPTSTSAVVSCKTKRIYIRALEPTPTSCNMALSQDPSLDTDDLYGQKKATTNNGSVNVVYDWGYSAEDSFWIGADGNTAAPTYTAATCGSTSVCNQAGLTAGVTYYFATRTRNTVTGVTGRWSEPLACRPQ